MVSDDISAPAMTRRHFLGAAATGAASIAVSACATAPRSPAYVEPQAPPLADIPEFGSYASMYAPVSDGGFEVPGVPTDKIDQQFLRQVVPDPTGEVPGTIVIDTSSHFLYLVREGGQAIRYGVGLGRAGFEWAGRGVIQSKQMWPRWFPPDEMIARQPELEQYRARQIGKKNEWEGGMPPGPDNPLGARALYIFQNGEDTLYRLHGSPEWWSIGKSVSSGCVRLINQDIIDLFGRVPEGTNIVVAGGLGTGPANAEPGPTALGTGGIAPAGASPGGLIPAGVEIGGLVSG
ncbi:L,D-transpeptidase [Mesorhizobium sp. LHD-90]|uniref:L,D-transpeptidase n=1 Tax=Mesorhizobium sp. LHD-90 TaxID=3071414 RepID=UPI0027E17B3C|nr:L,D-transpeptidase [Mesorhizobium sp. LHD-90]MDQ6438221.1 L,D-transpeptidase [Mesorhizobium sp. LHD-90]